VLVRIAYAADLPTPDEVIRSLGEENAAGASAGRPQGNGGATSAQASGFAPRFDPPRGAPRASAAPAASPVARLPDAAIATPVPTVLNFDDLVALAVEKRDLQIKAALERDVRLVRCEDGRLEIALEPGASKGLLNELSRKLSGWTGRQWMVVVSKDAGAPTLKAQADAREAELKRGVRGDPLVQALLERFPGAEIVAVRPPERNLPAADDDVPADIEAREDER
jgi:DNA polymerase-3 subunit gamma/tau